MFFKTTFFTLVLNVTNAHVSTTVVQERHEEVVTYVASKQAIHMISLWVKYFSKEIFGHSCF